MWVCPGLHHDMVVHVRRQSMLRAARGSSRRTDLDARRSRRPGWGARVRTGRRHVGAEHDARSTWCTPSRSRFGRVDNGAARRVRTFRAGGWAGRSGTRADRRAGGWRFATSARSWCTAPGDPADSTGRRWRRPPAVPGSGGPGRSGSTCRSGGVCSSGGIGGPLGSCAGGPRRARSRGTLVRRRDTRTRRGAGQGCQGTRGSAQWRS
jgi:hypothetical protein